MELDLKRHAVNVESPDMKQRMFRIVHNKVTSFIKAAGEQVVRMVTQYFHYVIVNSGHNEEFTFLLQIKAMWIQQNLDR